MNGAGPASSLRQRRRSNLRDPCFTQTLRSGHPGLNAYGLSQVGEDSHLKARALRIKRGLAHAMRLSKTHNINLGDSRRPKGFLKARPILGHPLET